MSFCTQYGPHFSSVKPLSVYQPTAHKSTYSLLMNYNNNSNNQPITLPPPQYQIPHYFYQNYGELPTIQSLKFNSYLNAYPKTF